MPDNRVLMVGGGDDYLPAAGCPVAGQKFGKGQYMAHQGDPNSFLVAEARVKDGSASVRVAVWRCVFCKATLVGLGDPEEPLGAQDFTWLERSLWMYLVVVNLPLVSVITPTWHRHDLLLERCVPSVWQQSYPNVEHIIVSDGPDPELSEKLFPPPRVGQRSRWFTCLPEHEPDRHWGHLARLHGIEMASGELITYCDDDDSLRSKHCELLVNALLENPEAGWAYSWMDSHNNSGGVTTIGQGEPSLGNIGTPMLMHRRQILEHGTWGPASDFEDWELVNRWLHVNIPYARVEETTIDVWPSIFFGH